MSLSADGRDAGSLAQHERSSERLSLLASVLIGIAYAVAAGGVIPALRQDWGPPHFWSDWHQTLLSTQGWSSLGLGSATSYFISGYLIAIPIAALSAIAGGKLTLFLTLWGIGAVCSLGARAAARDAGCGTLGTIAASLFAVLNPWVYSKLVAGHMFMILAYGGSIWFAREAMSARPNMRTIGVTLLAILQQIQFFFVAFLMLVPLIAIRRTWKPAAFALLLWLPVLIGMLGDTHTIRTMPFILAWERSQSVRPLGAVLLNGYFTNYSAIFNGIFCLPVLATLFLAVAGVMLGRRREYTVGVAAVFALSLAMGVYGPLSAAFSWAVVHIRPVALFRELFDVLAYVAIGYLMLATIACGRWRRLEPLWLTVALLLPIAWIASPPSHYWVSEDSIPQAPVHAEPNTRFALMPAFQPMSFNGMGSGADPDEFVRSNNVAPINEYLASYPVNAALSSFLLHGDRRGLETLSVSTIVERPWLQTNLKSLRPQWALPFDRFPPLTRYRLLHIDAYPELALLPLMPDVAGTRASDIRPVTAPNRDTDAGNDWVDAALAFAERPDLAQPYGGALTTNSRATLPIRNSIPALVFVDGSLFGGRDKLTGPTKGYVWISIPESVHDVRCQGLCVVAAQGTPLTSTWFSLAPRGRAVQFHQLLPWLATATLPVGPAAMIRYNVSYAEPWTAFLGLKRLAHYRLYDVVNGWVLPARLTSRKLVLVHLVSLAQFIAELLTWSVLLVLLTRAIGERIAGVAASGRAIRDNKH